jgi:hypothetical protein
MDIKKKNQACFTTDLIHILNRKHLNSDPNYILIIKNNNLLYASLGL